MTEEDLRLLKWYHVGFEDELNGTSSIISDIDIEKNAYALGACHAYLGDDVSNVDNLSDEEIVKMIRRR